MGMIHLVFARPSNMRSREAAFSCRSREATRRSHSLSTCWVLLALGLAAQQFQQRSKSIYLIRNGRTKLSDLWGFHLTNPHAKYFLVYTCAWSRYATDFTEGRKVDSFPHSVGQTERIFGAATWRTHRPNNSWDPPALGISTQLILTGVKLFHCLGPGVTNNCKFLQKRRRIATLITNSVDINIII